jgi:dihydroxy-acid dehydratase
MTQLPKYPVNFRSSEWFAGNDEVALAHRVVMASVGQKVDASNSKPIIGIADSSSDLNPCNLPLRNFIDEVKRGIEEAGGIPMVFPVMSLGEDLMKPSAMLYRNLLSIEVEEYLRSYPIDGVVLMANCDKSVPGALMGALSADLPTLMFTAGARPAAFFKGKKVGTGTELWRMWSDYRDSKITESEWKEFEACLNCGLGSCNTMGTASSVAMMVEALGLTLPGTSTHAEASPERKAAAYETGRQIVEMTKNGWTPSKILTAGSFRNAVRVLQACGGSTNAIIHLLALSGRVDGKLTLDQINALGEGLSVIVDVEPSGRELIQAFDFAGGVPALIAQLGEKFEGNELTALGNSWDKNLAPALPDSVIRNFEAPIYPKPAFAVVSGSLAPKGALLKVSAATDELSVHTGPAVVFQGYEDMRTRIDDPSLEITKDSVLILRNCGPVGVPGMPEWGMIPVPKRLLAEGVTDMVRISDARMSGTSFGTCILHVSPESAVGGPLAIIQDGDLVELDVPAGKLNLLISEKDFETRIRAWVRPTSNHVRGWPALYQQHVLQAEEGCDLDFLRPTSSEMRRFVPPVVGRS